MKINKYIILLLIMLFASSLYAQVSEYEYKAAFIERFTRFVKWPNKIKNDTFKIAVLGENPFNTSLDQLFNETKIKNKKVKLIYTDKIKDLADVNIVFISGSEKRKIEEILAGIAQSPVLIISDTKGFCEMGVHINMYAEDNYIRYEINQDAIKKSGLKVSSLLFASAKIVKTDD